MTHDDTPPLQPSSLSVADAASLLCSGEVVAFPTETVYGLGADATDPKAVAQIFVLKGRPSTNPLILHVRDLAHASEYVTTPPLAEQLASAFWPGPLTLVLPRRNGCAIAPAASAGGDTLGVRAPAHPLARQLLTTCGLPLAAPSANPSGRISPTAAAHVRGYFPELSVLDGGPCPVGIESTVVRVEDGQLTLLRPGSITPEQLEKTTGMPPICPPATEHNATSPLASPGMLASHYAPRLPVRLNVIHPASDEAYLGFGAHTGAPARRAVNLSPAGDMTEAAAHLFAGLQALDDPAAFTAIAVAPIPAEGIGRAINDRLHRAAAEKQDTSGIP